jgi:hypothetical protein
MVQGNKPKIDTSVPKYSEANQSDQVDQPDQAAGLTQSLYDHNVLGR